MNFWIGLGLALNVLAFAILWLESDERRLAERLLKERVSGLGSSTSRDFLSVRKEIHDRFSGLDGRISALRDVPPEYDHAVDELHNSLERLTSVVNERFDKVNEALSTKQEVLNDDDKFHEFAELTNKVNLIAKHAAQKTAEAAINKQVPELVKKELDKDASVEWGSVPRDTAEELNQYIATGLDEPALLKPDKKSQAKKASAKKSRKRKAR